VVFNGGKLKRILLISVSLLLLALPAAKAQDAPITTAGRTTTATPLTNVTVPVNVTGFNVIGQFTLTMIFDITNVQYVSATTNPSLSGMTVTYTPPSDNNYGKLVFTWTGTGNVSLSDGSSIVNLTFSYTSGTGLLIWDYSYGSVCQYKRWVSGVLTVLNDSPQYLFYLNGGISNRSAPVTMAPTIASPVTGTLPLAIKVNGFTTIGALTLYMEYDPAIITYLGTFTKNGAFGSNFVVGDITGFGSKRMIVIQWYGSSVTLANGSTLCTLNFSYPSYKCDPCLLSWYDSGPTCEYADASGDVLIDMPQVSYYLNGIVASALSYTWTGKTSSAWNITGNWNDCGIPDITRDITIPNVSPRSFPVITVAAYCKSILIQTGATVTVSPTGSITVGNN
jgi:hypothetical protein